MLLELKQSDLAVALAEADVAIIALLTALADAGSNPDYEQITAGWQHSRRPKKAAIEAVLALPQRKRRALGDAVRADLGFGTSLDDDHFRFQFPQLDAATHKAGKALLVSMYDDVFRHEQGFALAAGGFANRSTWEQAFRDANPGLWVCPACLIANLDQRIEGRSAIDADHYLPKSTYPPLAVHGLNLVPLCKICNDTAKGTKDPLSSGGKTHGLPSIWFPYRRPGLEELDVSFDPSRGSDSPIVKVDGVSGAELRAKLFDALFSLSERWSQRLEGIHNSIRTNLRERVPQLEQGAVKHELATLAAIADEEVAKAPPAYVNARYCTWLANDEHALRALIEELADGGVNAP